MAPRRTIVRCDSPGATYAVPGDSTLPSSASTTCMGDTRSRSAASGRTNPASVCCTMTTGGASSGSSRRIASSAIVPPVEAPIAITGIGRDTAGMVWRFLEKRGKNIPNVLRLERLLDESALTETSFLLASGAQAFRRNDDSQHMPPSLFTVHHLKELDAGHDGHVDVGEDGINRRAHQDVERLRPIRRLMNLPEGHARQADRPLHHGAHHH